MAKNSSRRNFILQTGLILAGAGISAGYKNQIPISISEENEKVPLIHVTDLYHTHGDPDDHWDLATIYSLAYSEEIDLKGILIDFPPKHRLGDPDVLGIAQLNYIAGLAVPVVIGTPHLMTNRNDITAHGPNSDYYGVNWIINTLKNSKTPVVINIVGAATDIAIAAKKEPELFNEKCRAIYLNAGSAYNGEDNKLEFNVRLNPSAFAAIFDINCPIYWLPCWNKTEVHQVGEFGSYYRFKQGEILPSLPDRLQNFFLFMLGKKKDHKWLSFLNSKVDKDALNHFSSQFRNMWCTAGFINSIQKKVTSTGDIVPINSEYESIFSFDPIDVKCDDDGITTWKLNNHNDKRFILHIKDMDKYQQAIALAMKKMLLLLPA